MAIRPIIFSGPMIQAILEGRKTQTRRVIKVSGRLPEFCGGRHDLEDPACYGWEDAEHGDWVTLEKYRGQRMGWRDLAAAYAPGDRLWVREAWKALAEFDDRSPSQIPRSAQVQYLADMPLSEWHSRYRPSRFMPRWASRITMVVTDVRVQRVQEISEAEAEEEGVKPILVPPDGGSSPHIEGFLALWDSLHTKSGHTWDTNPWVAAITFRPVFQNVDDVRE